MSVMLYLCSVGQTQSQESCPAEIAAGGMGTALSNPVTASLGHCMLSLELVTCSYKRRSSSQTRQFRSSLQKRERPWCTLKDCFPQQKGQHPYTYNISLSFEKTKRNYHGESFTYKYYLMLCDWEKPLEQAEFKCLTNFKATVVLKS